LTRQRITGLLTLLMPHHALPIVVAALLASGSVSAQQPDTAPDVPPLIPKIVGSWVHVYQPAADVFPGPDSTRFKSGQSYPKWQVNDHAILKGPDGRWHAFGITHPAVPHGEPNPHEAEWLLFHAATPSGALKQHCLPGQWKDEPKVLPPAERPGEIREIHSPSILRHADRYWMFYGYSPIRLAVSQDLKTWQPQGEVFRQEGSARDPSVSQHDGKFYMCYTTRQSILMRTSPDLLHWSEPSTVFSLAPGETGGPESPTLLPLHGGFYLVWCRWDAKLSAVGSTYQSRSFVYFSKDPLNFRDRAPIAELEGHAPELFQDEEGDWWISSAEHPNPGLSLAPVRWEPPTGATLRP
jgi:arabinan endo-1,5-alpha-L-arabinosidase